MAYDSDRDRVVMVAGRENIMGTALYPQETWEFDGVDWHLIGPVGPIAYGGYNDTTNVRAYYDSRRHVTVAIEFSTSGQTNFLEWNGATWVTVRSVPSSTFPYRFAFEVAYDAIRGVAVIFGGSNGNVEYSDTWEFNGTNLVHVLASGPQARWAHAMAYDAARGVVVLYGGVRSGGITLSDMWDWNGTTWQPTPNPSGPGARAFHGLAYDRARSRLVLIGNWTAGFAETWEWQPSGWTITAAGNSARSNMAVVYDDLRERVLTFGGLGASLPTAPTTTFAFGEIHNLAAISSYGSGCAGPSGVPLLHANTLPSLGTVLSVQFSNLPPGPLSIVFGWIGFDNTVWNGMPLPAALDPLFPGCTAYMAPVTSYSLGTTPNGLKTWEMAIPFMPNLSGTSFYLEGGVFVPGFNPGQVAFTNALAGTLGR